MCYWWIWDDLGLKQVATLSLALACPLITIISYAGSLVIGRPCHIVTLHVLVGKQHKNNQMHKKWFFKVSFTAENGWRNSINLWCPSALSCDKSCSLWGSSNPIRTGGSTLNEGSRCCVAKPWLLTVQKSQSIKLQFMFMFCEHLCISIATLKEFENHPLQANHFLYPSINLETWFSYVKWLWQNLAKSSSINLDVLESVL